MSPSDPVSIVVALYNKESYIGRAICSILEQTHNHFELIIVDDGSTDRSLERARAFDDKRIRIVQQRNLGISAARNTGISRCSHELVGFLDADDYWERTYLQTIVELAHEFPQAGMYATGYRLHYDQTVYTKVLSAVEGKRTFLVEDYFEKIRGGKWGIHTSSAVVRKKVLDSLGRFPIGIASPKEQSLYILKASGEIVCKVRSAIAATSAGVPLKREDPIRLPDELAQLVDLRVINIHGEDAYLWDYIAFYHPIAYCSDILSNYSGDVPGQGTKSSTDEAASATINNLYREIKSNGNVKNAAVIKRYMRAQLFGRILAAYRGQTYGDLAECLDANHARFLAPVFNVFSRNRLLRPIVKLILMWKLYQGSRKVIGFVPKRAAKDILLRTRKWLGIASA